MYDFGWAIEQLKNGNKVKRAMWVKSVWIELVPLRKDPVTGDEYDPYLFQDGHGDEITKRCDISHDEILAEDWVLADG